MDNNIEVNENSLQKLLTTVCENIKEERDLALERYRRQDEQVETNEQFVLQGKHMVDFLKTASDRTDSLMNLTKMIFSVIHKDNNGSTGSGSSMDEKNIKKFILQNIEDEKYNANISDYTDLENDSKEKSSD